MPSYREFEGKDIENVAKKASKKLNIPPEKLKYDVISYGSTGIFGLVGAKKARIRVTVPDAAIETAPQNSAAKPPENGVLKENIPQHSLKTDATCADQDRLKGRQRQSGQTSRAEETETIGVGCARRRGPGRCAGFGRRR